jgi:hypothetical protein
MMTERMHHDPPNTPPHSRPTLLMSKAQVILLVLALIGAVGCAIGWVVYPKQFYHSYLTGYVFCLTLALGMLFFVMLHHVVDAGWSTVIRRSAEQVLACMPVLIVLFAPILIGTLNGGFYKWTYTDPAEDAALEWKRPFLNLPMFVAAAVVYFAVWMLLSWIMRGRSLRQDATGDPELTLSMQRWAPVGFILYALTFTFAMFHWVMALDFHWYSTIFGVYVWSGSVVGSLALLILMVIGLARGPLHGMIHSDTLHDLGKLLFGFSVFWAYIAFSQYFLIWYSNIAEETIWFLHRWTGTQDHPANWWLVSVLLPIGRFVVPFVVLMSAIPKRHPMVMVVTSIFLIVMHYIDIYWMVMPVLHAAPALQWLWLDLAAVLLVGGVSALVVVRALAAHPLYPIRDPRLHEALEMDHNHVAAQTPG